MVVVHPAVVGGGGLLPRSPCVAGADRARAASLERTFSALGFSVASLCSVTAWPQPLGNFLSLPCARLCGEVGQGSARASAREPTCRGTCPRITPSLEATKCGHKQGLLEDAITFFRAS